MEKPILFDLATHLDNRGSFTPLSLNLFEKKWIQSWHKRQWKNVKNPDLWKELIVLVDKHKVTWKWIKGHAGHEENERCDRLAVNARMKSNLKIDAYFESQEGQHLI